MAESRPAGDELPADTAYLNLFLDEDPSLPTPDAVLGLTDEPTPGERREAARLARMTDEERLAELLENPNVQAVLEAAQGMEPVRA